MIEYSLGRTNEPLRANILNSGQDLRKDSFWKQNFKLISLGGHTAYIKISLQQQYKLPEKETKKLQAKYLGPKQAWLGISQTEHAQLHGGQVQLPSLTLCNWSLSQLPVPGAASYRLCQCHNGQPYTCANQRLTKRKNMGQSEWFLLFFLSFPPPKFF